MIRNTFSIFPKIGPRTERRLWRHGVFTWRDFLERGHIPGFSDERKAALNDGVASAHAALEAGEINYFQRLLGPGGIWRLWGGMSDSAVCLDIETDGGRPPVGAVTVAGFHSHGEYRAYVLGRDLTEEALKAEFREARLLVTYFGGGFDLPYLKAVYPGLDLDVPHFDLCPAGHKVGLKGGLKNVERLVGIQRAEEVEGMSGLDAVVLWRAHLRGAPGALDKLIEYNREDTVNLHALAWIIYGRLREETGLPAIMAETPPPREYHPKA